MWAAPSHGLDLSRGRVERDSREKGKQATPVLLAAVFVFRLTTGGQGWDSPKLLLVRGNRNETRNAAQGSIATEDTLPKAPIK